MTTIARGPDQPATAAPDAGAQLSPLGQIERLAWLRDKLLMSREELERQVELLDRLSRTGRQITPGPTWSATTVDSRVLGAPPTDRTPCPVSALDRVRILEQHQPCGAHVQRRVLIRQLVVRTRYRRKT